MSQRQKLDAWVGTLASARNEGYGLHTYTEPTGRFSAVYTSEVLLDFSFSGGKERLECRPMLITDNASYGASRKVYMIGFRAISEDLRFSRTRSRLTIVADNRPIALGTPIGFKDNNLLGAIEIFFYRASWASLKKIADAKKVEIRIDKRQAALKDSDRELIKQLVTATQ